MPDIVPAEYGDLVREVKERVRAAQYAALKAVNHELVGLYWDIGWLIAERQQGETWGQSVVAQLATDLQAEFPGVGGFSERNIWKMPSNSSSSIVNAIHSRSGWRTKRNPSSKLTKNTSRSC